MTPRTHTYYDSTSCHRDGGSRMYPKGRQGGDLPSYFLPTCRLCTLQHFTQSAWRTFYSWAFDTLVLHSSTQMAWPCSKKALSLWQMRSSLDRIIQPDLIMKLNSWCPAVKSTRRSICGSGSLLLILFRSGQNFSYRYANRYQNTPRSTSGKILGRFRTFRSFRTISANFGWDVNSGRYKI